MYVYMYVCISTSFSVNAILHIELHYIVYMNLLFNEAQGKVICVHLLMKPDKYLSITGTNFITNVTPEISSQTSPERSHKISVVRYPVGSTNQRERRPGCRLILIS